MKYFFTIITHSCLLLLFPSLINGQQEEGLAGNFKYSPKWWQSTVNLPNSARKTAVGKEGQLLYEFPISNADTKPESNYGYSLQIAFNPGENVTWKNQQLFKPEVPLVITKKEFGKLLIEEEVFTVAPLFFGENDTSIADYLGKSIQGNINGLPGNEIIIVTLENRSNSPILYSPSLRISSSHPIITDTCKRMVSVSNFIRVTIPYPITETIKENNQKQQITTLVVKPINIEPGQRVKLAFGIAQGHIALDCPSNIEQALSLRKQSIQYWENLNLPYNKIVIPDSGIQQLLNASIRNIYQSCELEKGVSVFKTGPSSNRQAYLSDVPFILNALTFLNQTATVKPALESMLKLQNADGSFMQHEKDWKETGFVLWSMANYARLTGDKQWLETYWGSFEKGFNFLSDLHKTTLKDTKSPSFGLLPPGGKINTVGADYSYTYWALTGMNSAISAARWIGRNGQAMKWQNLYDEFFKSFQESANKNMKKDAFGNSYLPVRLGADKKPIPPKAQWAFLNAIYPGKLFDLNDPILTGNLKMLAKNEKEGLLFNTGWVNNGIVNTTASDYAHALLWTGKGQEAAKKLYSLANHASPVFAWREIQLSADSNEPIISGDMPNNRISAEFIRLARNLIVLERSNDLHLLEGVPGEWTKPGKEIQLNGVLTDFGLLNFKLKIADDGNTATIDLNLDSSNRRPPLRTILHLEGITGNPATIELELKPNLHKILNLN